MQRALVVGGTRKFADTFRDKLARHNITVGWHVARSDGKVPYSGVPSTCDVVIIDVDGVTHDAAERAFHDAKAKGKPSVRVHDQWSRAEGILRMKGLLAPKTEAFSVKAQEIKGHAIQYIVDAQVEEMRVPHIEEVETAIQRAFGIPSPFSKQEWEGIYHMAAGEVAKVNTPGPSMSELKELVRLEIEANLDFITDRDGLEDKIRASSPELPLTQADAVEVRSEVDVVLAEWNQHHTHQTSAVRTHKLNAIRNWFKSQIEASQKNGGKGWPGGDEVVRRLAKMGIRFSTESLVQLRREILGDWAIEMFPVSRILKLHFPTEPITVAEVISKLEIGEIRGVMIEIKGKPQWQVSRTEIERYLAARASVPPPPPDPVVVPESPKQAPSGDLEALAVMVVEDVLKRVGEKIEPVMTTLTAVQMKVADLVNTEEQARVMDEVQGLKEEVTALRETVKGMGSNFARVEALLTEIKAAMPSKGALAIAAALNSAGDYEVKMTKSSGR